MEHFIAIDNVCAWPNLTLMPDDAIIATIFNQPCHGKWEGDVESWVSLDGGRCWQFYGVPALHEPGTNRMNVAAGLAYDGALIVTVSGWSNRPSRGEELPLGKSSVLPPLVCRSNDGGKSWECSESVIVPGNLPTLIPYGDIELSPDGKLGVSFYGGNADNNSAYFLCSYDDGRTWDDPVLIGTDDYNETSLLCLDDSRWLAVSRTLKDGHLELFISNDSGRNWFSQGSLTLPGQHPGDLLRLVDGSVLLVYGIRNREMLGLGARMSSDEGKTWSAPMLLVDLEGGTDGGYPSSVQLKDGTIVTAYYCDYNKVHMRYHMGILRWQAE